eukprot:TRINITY_DN818_c0_g1_i1.p1 TRINITY_DN818_c0_g1~~TRINITY_DN818_c0_g1_i1.p1  ORF type:complete len:374 (-),score=131.78 TRINITY_DN818_c0_g1_i1:121-1203(-)
MLRNLKSLNTRSSQPLLKRNFANRPSGDALALKYTQHGNPKSVLKLEKLPLPSKLQDNEVLVKMLASPINPADLNMIEGNYGRKVPLPAVAGNEGVGVVVEAGPKSDLKVNDRVIPSVAGLGTWRDYGVFDSKDMTKVPSDLSVESLATVAVNPATALRLLDDFATLKEGDVVIQNGANSAVGIALIQIAASRGIKTINVVRQRGQDEFQQMHYNLKQFGADIVVSDEYLQTAQFKRLLSEGPAPKLALNCVGGQSATDIARTLGENGTLVTYGGMSRKPVTLPTSLFIFKNIQSKGFWLTRWNEANPDKQKESLEQIFNMIRSNKLKVFAEKRYFKDWEDALDGNAKLHKDRKIIMSME